MRLTVVGSSDAFNSRGRTHSSYLLEGDGVGPLMIDFGGSALAGLRRLGRSPTELSGIALTHLHGDHVGGFAFLVIDGMFNDVRHAPLEIVGPVLSRARIEEVVETAYGPIVTYKRPYEMPVREIAPGDVVELCGARIEAFAADHMDAPEQALCLRVTAGGKSVAFSGDTRVCDGLFQVADGVDLLVAECTSVHHPCGRHCAWDDWLQMLDPASARRIGAKRVLLSHLGAEVRGRASELRAEVPHADVAFADDGMIVEL